MKRIFQNSGALFLLIILLSIGCKKKDSDNKKEQKDFVFNTEIATADHGGPFSIDCGGFDWKVKFTLDTITPNGGYFIQEVNLNFVYDSLCPDYYENLQLTFYEAWRVNPGQRVTIYRQADQADFDDQYFSPAYENSRGSVRAFGVLKYFDSITLPATMIANNPNTFAGDLPSDTLQPFFWNQVAGIPHNASSNWDCCGRDTSRAIFVPAPNVQKPKKLIDWKDKDFFAKVKGLKPWVSEEFKPSDFEMYQEVGKELSKFNKEQLLNYYKSFEKWVDEDTEELSKLFILSRVIFDVPEAYSVSQSKSYGGWLRPLPKNNMYNLLWPVESKKGSLVLEIEFNGYIGASYDAAGEINYFAERFDRRK